MKKLIYLVALLALCIQGCEKQETYDELQGTWKIIGVSGSTMGFQSIRDFDKVIFNHSNNYLVSFNDTVIQAGSYKIEKQFPKKFGNIKVEFLLILNESFNSQPYANFYPEFTMDIIL